MKTWVVIGDIQIPWQDTKVLRLVTDFIRDLKPQGVILNGDIVDCYAISDFSKDPEHVHKWGLKREITDARKLMESLETIPQKWWLGGNHEDRWRRVQWQFPNLQGMFQDFPKAFHMAEHGFEWKPYGAIVMLGKLIVTHGSSVNRHSGWTARAHFEKYGNSVLIGHTHRLGVYYRTNAKGVHAAYENGCLCKMRPEYVQYPDWQQGISVVHVASNGFYNVQQIPVLNRKTLFYGNEMRSVA